MFIYLFREAGRGREWEREFQTDSAVGTGHRARYQAPSHKLWDQITEVEQIEQNLFDQNSRTEVEHLTNRTTQTLSFTFQFEIPWEGISFTQLESVWTDV